METQNGNNLYVKQVREQYAAHEPTKLDELKALDSKVKLPALVTAIVLGVVAALVLGVGMCMAMQVIGTAILAPNVLMAVGIVIGCVGIGLGVADYFIYKAILKSRKSKYGDRIMALSDELLNK